MSEMIAEMKHTRQHTGFNYPLRIKIHNVNKGLRHSLRTHRLIFLYRTHRYNISTDVLSGKTQHIARIKC